MATGLEAHVYFLGFLESKGLFSEIPRGPLDKIIRPAGRGLTIIRNRQL